MLRLLVPTFMEVGVFVCLSRGHDLNHARVTPASHSINVVVQHQNLRSFGCFSPAMLTSGRLLHHGTSGFRNLRCPEAAECALGQR